MAQQRMKSTHIQTLLVTSPRDLGWLIGLFTPGNPPVHCAVLRADSPKINLVTRRLEMGNVEHARPRYSQLSLHPYDENDDAISLLAKVVTPSPLLTVDATHMSAAVFEKLQRELMTKGIRTQGIEVSPIACARVTKDCHELSYMTRAAEATTLAILAVANNMEVGRFETEVAHLAAGEICHHGASPATYPIFIHAGSQGGQRGHCAADPNRMIERCSLVMMEVGASFRSYHAARMHTFFMGSRKQLSVSILCAERAVASALNSMQVCAKGGCIADEIAQAGLRELHPMREHGWNLSSRLGYSIGISQGVVDWGEADIISISAGSEDVVPSGATLHLIPHITHPRYGAIGFSKTVLVEDQRASDLADSSNARIDLCIHCIE